MKRPLSRRKKAIAGVAGALLLGGGAAFAFFAATGTGTGGATTGKTTSLTIQQIGAGYSSLIPTNTYSQDQTFGGAGITELGNDVTLAGTGDQNLVSVVVAMRNWGGAITDLPITLTINKTIATPVNTTQDFSFPAAISANEPSTTDITFTLGSQGVYVQHEFVYGIAFAATGTAGGLNVALSNSTHNLSVGTDTDPGTVYVAGTYPTLGHNFPACTTYTPPTFAQVTTHCGPQSPTNPGAYGTTPGNADIPAVQFNVVGGIVPSLYPGAPAQPVNFAIINPGPSSVKVTNVSTTVAGVTGTGSTSNPTCTSSWYTVGGSPAPVNATVPTGTTIVDPSGTTISLTTEPVNQNNCQGATVKLHFAST